MVGSVSDNGFHPSQDPPGIDDPVRFRVCSSQQWQKCDASIVFWLFFQVNLILINHPHQPSFNQ